MLQHHDLQRADRGGSCRTLSISHGPLDGKMRGNPEDRDPKPGFPRKHKITRKGS